MKQALYLVEGFFICKIYNYVYCLGMHFFDAPVPKQTVLRAIARAQAEPLHDDIKRMEIAFAMMECVLDVAKDLPQKITTNKGMMCVVNEIRDDIGSHAAGKSTACTNKDTLVRLGLVFEELEFHIASIGPKNLHTALAKSMVHAARNFLSTTGEDDNLKKAWAKKETLPQQSPFTAFTIANEIMIRVMPKIEAAYPDATKRAWGERWDAREPRKLRAISARNYEVGTADADDIENVCGILGKMSQYIAGVRSAFTDAEKIRADCDLNCRTLKAVSFYLSPYMPRMEDPTPPAGTPDNIAHIKDFRRARLTPRPL